MTQTVDQSQVPQVIAMPAKGAEQTVSVGSTLYEYGKYIAFDVATPSQTMRVAPLLIPLIIEANTPLYRVSTSVKFKACTGMGDGPCALDDDGDGTFDRIAKDNSSAGLKLKAPVPYATHKVPRETPDSIKTILIYSGATSDTLRLSYREFRNDMARPAFTEDLSIPITRQFPETIAVKDIKVTLLGISGLGLRYRIE